jgi:hypothetical protein
VQSIVEPSIAELTIAKPSIAVAIAPAIAKPFIAVAVALPSTLRRHHNVHPRRFDVKLFIAKPSRRPLPSHPSPSRPLPSQPSPSPLFIHCHHCRAFIAVTSPS